MAQGVLTAEVQLEGQWVKAVLSPGGVLEWNGESKSGRLDLLADILGFRRGASTILLHTFQMAEGGCFKAPARTRKDILIDFNDSGAHSDWCSAIQTLLDSSGRPKRLLVLVNPKGGAGNAKKRFKESIEPLLVAAGIELSIVETQFHGHATEVAKEAQLGSLDGIVCISGDGILVQLLNGLLARDDWQDAIRTPLGIIPSGSSNAMAKALLHEGGEAFDAANATFAIIRGQKRQVDVFTVSQGTKQFHGLLNLLWGLVSDVDVESEKYRWMGGFRITFQSLVRMLLKPRKYRGRFSYIPAYEQPLGRQAGTPGARRQADLDASLRGQELQEAAESATPEAPSQKLLGQQVGVSEEGGDWTEVDGEFVLLWIQNVKWGASDILVAPHAQFADGCLDMIVVRDCPRLQLLKLFMQMEDGRHVTSPYVEYVKIKALRLEPGGRAKGKVSGGYIGVDGEVLARGVGAEGNGSDDPLVYGELLEVSIQQGLAATLFASA